MATNNWKEALSLAYRTLLRLNGNTALPDEVINLIDNSTITENMAEKGLKAMVNVKGVTTEGGAALGRPGNSETRGR